MMTPISVLVCLAAILSVYCQPTSFPLISKTPNFVRRSHRSAHFAKGVNQPWGKNAFGRSFASGINGSPECIFNDNEWDTVFDSASKIRARTVRVWPFAGYSGFRLDSYGRLDSIDPEFWENFDTLIDLADNYDIEIYPTLLSGPPSQVQGTHVADFFTDNDAQQALLDNLVKPFVQRYARRVPIIDLFNELNIFSDVYFDAHIMTPNVATDWLKSTIKAARQADPQVMLTVSQVLITDFAQAATGKGDNNIFSGLGLDAYDVHHYAIAGNVNLPGVTDLKLRDDVPTILGEFGESAPSSEASQASLVHDFLSQAKKGGYLAALYWTLGHAGESQDVSAISDKGQCAQGKIIQSLFRCDGRPRQALDVFSKFH